MGKDWTDDELYELDLWADYGDKGQPCPWKVVVECVNKEFRNNRSAEACRKRWSKYVDNEILDITYN